ncbi:hypothetical protein [Paenibacillus herberti]|uniref:Uncharacterized protein n=1 Tax=Paenibacillus herberti TaxID=1619309 RepID=A0A229NWT4_9BACL|nr:hypothetical protein [Paenibacillus herberti]OXM14393.1 hypothetical protein CGZ75_15720 [Paenibacillus herberti]
MSIKDVNSNRFHVSSLGITLVLFILLVVIVYTFYKDPFDQIDPESTEPGTLAVFGYVVENYTANSFILQSFSNKGIRRDLDNETIKAFPGRSRMYINDARYGETTAVYNAYSQTGDLLGRMSFRMEYHSGQPFQFTQISLPPGMSYTRIPGRNSGMWPAYLNLY